MGPSEVITLVIILGIFVLLIASVWKIYVKAGQPGWAAIVPIYNDYVLTTGICKLGVVWFILKFVPLIGIVAAIHTLSKLSQSFGRGAGTTIGLIFLPFIFFPILGFGSAQYVFGKDRGGRSRNGRDYGNHEDDDEDDDREPRRKRRDDY